LHVEAMDGRGEIKMGVSIPQEKGFSKRNPAIPKEQANLSLGVINRERKTRSVKLLGVGGNEWLKVPATRGKGGIEVGESESY